MQTICLGTYMVATFVHQLKIRKGSLSASAKKWQQRVHCASVKAAGSGHQRQRLLYLASPDTMQRPHAQTSNETSWDENWLGVTKREHCQMAQQQPLES